MEHHHLFMAMHPSPVPPIEVSCIQSLFVNFVLALIFAQFHERDKKRVILIHRFMKSQVTCEAWANVPSPAVTWRGENYCGIHWRGYHSPGS